jgi:hypothetical protein
MPVIENTHQDLSVLRCEGGAQGGSTGSGYLGVSTLQFSQPLRLPQAILDACCDAWNALMAKS